MINIHINIYAIMILVLSFMKKTKFIKSINLNGEEITSLNQISCNYYSGESFKNNELNQYLNLCSNFIDFYYCERFDKPEKKYDIEDGESCPEENYLLLLYILCVLIILIDIVITMLPWGVEYISLKRIVGLMNVTRRKANSNNSTQKSSIVTENEESFKKSKTEVIISPLDNEEEDIVTVKKRKLIIQSDDNINNEENKNRAQPIKIVQSSERNRINGSIQVFSRNDQYISTEMNNQNLNNNLRNQVEISQINSKKK